MYVIIAHRSVVILILAHHATSKFSMLPMQTSLTPSAFSISFLLRFKKNSCGNQFESFVCSMFPVSCLPLAATNPQPHACSPPSTSPQTPHNHWASCDRVCLRPQGDTACRVGVEGLVHCFIFIHKRTFVAANHGVLDESSCGP